MTLKSLKGHGWDGDSWYKSVDPTRGCVIAKWYTPIYELLYAATQKTKLVGGQESSPK